MLVSIRTLLVVLACAATAAAADIRWMIASSAIQHFNQAGGFGEMAGGAMVDGEGPTVSWAIVAAESRALAIKRLLGCLT